MYRRLGMWLGLVGIMCGIAVVFPRSVSAETGGYPFSSKPCVHAPYAVHSTKINWCRNYDWGDRRGDTSRSNVISPYGYYYRNCTDYVAWKLATLGVAPAQYKGLGDAKRWAAPPAKNGLRVDDAPAVGAVAVRTTGTYGHVAFVEAVDSSGIITVSEYNKRADGNFGVRTGTPAALNFTRFVHFEAYLPTPTPPTPPTPAPEPVPAPPAPQPVSAAVVPQPVIPDVKGSTNSPAATLTPESIAPTQQRELPAPAVTQPANSDNKPTSPHHARSKGVSAAAGSGPEKGISTSAGVQAMSGPSPAHMASVDTTPAIAQVERLASVAIEPPNTVPAESSAQFASSAHELPAKEDPPVSKVADATANEPLQIMASTLPVPHQWWRQAVQSPPGSLVGAGPQVAVFAQQVVSPLGYWALGALVVGTVLRELYGVMPGMLLWRRIHRETRRIL